MRINHNISSINTNRLLAGNNKATSGSLEKLSSGLAVNRAGDNAAGLAISEKMRGQIRGLNKAMDNANDGISLIQTAEGGLNETHAILQRMRELAVQSANDTNTAEDRQEIQKEVDQLTTEITRISTDTEFNTRELLNGSLAAKIEAGTVDFGDTNATDVKIVKGANLTVSGKYTIEISNISVGANHQASTLTASVGDKDDLNTFAQAGAKTLQYTGGKWMDGSSEVTPADIGISLTGTAVEGDTIAVSQYTPAVTLVDATASLKDTNRNFKHYIGLKDGMQDALNDLAGSAGKELEYRSSKWMDGTTDVTTLVESLFNFNENGVDGEGDIIVLTGYTPYSAAVDATLSVTRTPAVTNGTDTTYDIEITNPDNEIVSSSAFDITGVSANGTIELDIDADAALVFHIGANSGQNTKLTIYDMSASSLGVDAVDLTTQAAADSAIETIDDAIDIVSAQRAALGAMQNRLEHTINNLGTSSENLSAAESQIRDVDMAVEMSNYTKNNILVQAATSMLAQANQQPQNVLSLLRG